MKGGTSSTASLAASLTASQWKSRFQRSSCRKPLSLLSVAAAKPCPRACYDIQHFQQEALIPKRPCVFPRDAGSPTLRLPALSRWFSEAASPAAGHLSLWSYLSAENSSNWLFPYELFRPSESLDTFSQFLDSLMSSTEVTDQIMAGVLQSAVPKRTEHEFFQVHAPLRLLRKALEFNASRKPGAASPLSLYIAQSSLSDLPQPMQDDLPVPELVQRAGRGDVYSSSIWLGTQPTYTPLHRDPNPNLFCQLYSQKSVRLLPPAVGHRVFHEVQARIQRRGNSRIRTTDMMEGDERRALHDAVWEASPPTDQMYPVSLDAGDALFIPEGWWHSVKSGESDGKLNCSVNWWFR